MLIDPKCKLEKVAMKASDARFGGALSAVMLEGDRAIVTNAHALAVVQVERDSEQDADADGLLPVEAIKASRRRKDMGGLPPGTIVANNGTVGIPGGAQWPRPEGGPGAFPNWRRVWPKDQPVAHRVSLNAKLLADLAAALGSKDGIVSIVFPEEENGAIVVHAKGGNAGLLMPCRDRSDYGPAGASAEPTVRPAFVDEATS
tara:strand:+ start:277 stop:882 length:606 start_codon:yes stop_codon:yes gene_type:complete